MEAFINLAKSSKLLDLTTPSFRNVDRWRKKNWTIHSFLLINKLTKLGRCDR